MTTSTYRTSNEQLDGRRSLVMNIRKPFFPQRIYGTEWDTTCRQQYSTCSSSEIKQSSLAVEVALCCTPYCLQRFGRGFYFSVCWICYIIYSVHSFQISSIQCDHKPRGVLYTRFMYINPYPYVARYPIKAAPKPSAKTFLPQQFSALRCKRTRFQCVKMASGRARSPEPQPSFGCSIHSGSTAPQSPKSIHPWVIYPYIHGWYCKDFGRPWITKMGNKWSISLPRTLIIAIGKKKVQHTLSHRQNIQSLMLYHFSLGGLETPWFRSDVERHYVD